MRSLEKIQGQYPYCLAVAMGLSLFSLHAQARYDETDHFKLIASLSTLHDNNVFRLADGQSSGDLSRSDTIYTPTVRALYDNTFSRQQFSIDASIFQPHYQNNSEMQYTGHETNVKWNGAVGELWHPQLGYQNSQDLASFEDVVLGVKDMINEQIFSGGLAYGGERNGKALVDASRKEKYHDTQRYLNLVDQGFGLAGGWITDKGTQATLRYDNRDIHFTEPLAQVLTRDYSQNKLKLGSVWPVTPKVNLGASIGYIAWRFDANGSHSDDVFGGADASWQYSEKLRFSTAYNRDADDPGANLRLSMTNAYNLQADWRMTTKLGWNASWKRRDTTYGVVQNSPLPQQRDTTETYRLGLGWSPRDFFSGNLYVQSEERSSNNAFNEYQDEQVGLDLQFKY